MLNGKVESEELYGAISVFEKVFNNKKVIGKAPIFYDTFEATPGNKEEYYKALKIMDRFRNRKEFKYSFKNYHDTIESFYTDIDTTKTSEYVCSQSLLIFIFMRHVEKLILKAYLEEFPDEHPLTDDELKTLEALSLGYEAIPSRHKLFSK